MTGRIEPRAVDGALDAASIEQWREAGFALVDGLLPERLVADVAAAAATYFPAPGTPEAATIDQFGSGQQFRFPSRVPAINEVTVHPALLAAVSALLDEPVEGLRLTQSDVWPKYGRAPDAARDPVQDNDDQRLHCDYPNHTLVHPSEWSAPDAVEMIVYYSAATDCDGETALVPRRGADDPAYRWPIDAMPGVADRPYVNARTAAEADLAARAPSIAAFRADALYPREVVAHYRPGTVLFYRHDLWHRGRPVRPGSVRFAHNLTYRRAASEWIATLHPGWSWSMYGHDQFLERWIARASVEARTVLGFPAPGARYWNARTLAAVEARYGVFGFDPAPYRAALPA